MKKIIPQVKKKKAVKYSKNSDIEDVKESENVSNTEEGFWLIEEFVQ